MSKYFCYHFLYNFVDCVIFVAGGLFERNDKQQELAFRRALMMINTDNSILFNVELVADTQEVAPQDSFRALKKSKLSF